MMRRLAASLAILLAPALAVAQTPPAPPDPLVMAGRIQKFYDATKDLHAHFDQQLETGIGRKRNATGDVWLKKPGRMRWDYAKPEKKLMVADGTTLWVFEPDDQQAFKQDLKTSSLPSSVTFLWGQGKLSDEFEISIDKTEKPKPAEKSSKSVEAKPAEKASKPAKAKPAEKTAAKSSDGKKTLGGPGTVVLKLVPRQATAQYRYLVFVVDEATGMVKETVVYDQQGGSNHMSFRDVELNRGVGEDRFRFSPPAGTRILNQR